MGGVRGTEGKRCMVNISLLGSTGSVGTQALQVMEGLNRQGSFPVTVKVLGAGRNVALLEQQVRKWRPEAVAVFEESAAKDFRARTRDLSVPCLSGISGLCEAAAWASADLTFNAVMGMVGLAPTLAAIDAKKRIALSNKETLAAGGQLVMQAAKARGVSIIPVDSEHSAVFQCLMGLDPAEEGQGEAATLNARRKDLKKLILTASGGPFFGKTRKALAHVTLEQALKHPNWSMGAKITVDSATMMNKGLEVIEAAWLFDLSPGEIDVVVHRESIVHSMVMFQDNGVLAQMGQPDMAVPIQYSLTYPRRFPSPAKMLDLTALYSLRFEAPDPQAFPSLPLCLEALERGGLSTAAVNGANEAAVALFLAGKIPFLRIPELVEAAMHRQKPAPADSLSAVLAADQEARDFVMAHGSVR